jgi:N-acetylmuramic acid 6-phosphate etherase
MHIGPYTEIWGTDTPETERADPALIGMDLLSNDAILRKFLDSQLQAIRSVDTAIPALGAAANEIAEKLSDPDSRLIHAGAGSSGLLAMQDAMEMNPTFDWPLERQVFLMAGGDKARLQPIGPEEDNAKAGQEAARKHHINEKDVVIVVAASGTTPFSVDLLQASKEAGALTIAIANNPDTTMLNIAHHGIFLRSGPEVISGSTRMAAGTAQKAALGMLSSLVMIRMGHVVDGFMVNMVANNHKLQDRAARIVASIGNCNLDAARQALKKSDGAIKSAILIIQGLDFEQAEAVLQKAKGNLRQALKIITEA